jgi:RNA-binding protein YlmH
MCGVAAVFYYIVFYVLCRISYCNLSTIGKIKYPLIFSRIYVIIKQWSVKFMLEKDILIPRMEDLAERAVKTGFAVSKFLTPAEAISVYNYFKKYKNISLTLDGGYEGAERVRAVFLNADYGEYNRSELFTAFKIETRRETIGHRDILGSVMALGIERSAIGGILSEPPMLICLPEIAEYIAENLTQIGRANVKLTATELSEISPQTEIFDIKTNTVASVRLDSVASTAFNLPRSKAVLLIESGRVSLNHEVRLQPSKEVAEGDIISVRGMGRAKLLEIGGTSKKGRIFIKIGVQGKK